MRDFFRALDNVCPVSWLKEEAETEVDNRNNNPEEGVDEGEAGVYGVRVRRAGSGNYVRQNATGALSNSPKRKVIIYQKRGDKWEAA